MRKPWLAAWPSAWRRAGRLAWADRWLAAEAVFWLAAARLAVRLLPFRRFSTYLGLHMRESPQQDWPESRVLLRRVAWAVQAAAPRLPWRCMCLEQGVAGKMMLRRRHLSNTLYLGVASGDTGVPGMTAHAWLRSGSYILTGAAGREQYTVVSTFADNE